MAGINHKAVKSSHDTGTAAEWNDDHEQKGDHDCVKHQHLNHVIENRVNFPAGPVEGQVIFRTDEHKFYVWNNTEWVTFTSPATIVVAADGSGHYTDIQDGIDALPAAGGVVYIKEGTYSITTSILIQKHYITVVGAGRATIIEATAGWAAGEPMIKVGGPNVALQADYFHIEKIFLKGRKVAPATNDGINFEDSDRGRIIDCSIEDQGDKGISSGGTSEAIIIQGNFITGCAVGGIQSGADDSFMNNNTIISNGLHGISLSGTNKNIITNNLINSNIRHGIAINSSHDNVVDGNIIKDNDFNDTVTYDGIYLSNSDNNIISNNRCEDNDRWEINISNNTCDKNIVMGNHCLGADHVGAINDAGVNTLPNGVGGTNALSLDDHNIIA